MRETPRDSAKHVVGMAVIEITDNGASYRILLAIIITASHELAKGDIGFPGTSRRIGPRRSAV